MPSKGLVGPPYFVFSCPRAVAVEAAAEGKVVSGHELR